MRLSKNPAIFALLMAITIATTACGTSGGETTKPTTAAAATTAAQTEKPTTAAPATTAVPATTEPATAEPTTTYSGETVIPVDNLSTYMSIGENRGWLDTIFSIGEGNTGRQFASFNLTPLADGVEGGVYFADYDKDVEGIEDLPIMVRMSGGIFDASNGDVFGKLAQVPIVTNKVYFFELFTDMDAKTYTVYVTPAGEDRVLLAENYKFAATANDADDLGKLYFVSAAANDEFKADTFERMAIYTEGQEYWSYGENYGWQQHPIYLGKAYTGKVKIEFDMFANTQPIGGSVSFADIDRDVYGFGDLCMLCRMNLTFYDARNGDVFETIGNVPVAMNNVYHCEIQADLDAKTHSMWVTAPGGERTLIAENYAFRTTANDADDIGKFYVISEHASDQIGMKNLQISNMD